MKIASPAGSPVLEQPDCALCGPGPLRRLYGFPPYRVVRCEGCGLVFLSPRPIESEALDLYQEPSYYESTTEGRGYDEYLEVRQNWQRTFERRLRRIRRYQPAGRVLDVGCGPGFFLDAARSMGYQAWGIDPSAYAVRLAGSSHGGRVKQGTLGDHDEVMTDFDLLVASDVFEHVYQPLRFVAQAHRALKPNGLLAITTPDPTSWLARISGRRWVSFKIPEHVYYWSPSTIRRALSPAFTVLEIAGAGQYATIGFLLRRLLRVGAGHSRTLGRIIALLNRATVYANNGSLTVIARRSEVDVPATGGASEISAGGTSPRGSVP